MMTHSTGFGKAIVALAVLAILGACAPTGSPQQEFGWQPEGASPAVSEDFTAPSAPISAVEPDSGFAPVPDFSDENEAIVLEVMEGELEEIESPPLVPAGALSSSPDAPPATSETMQEPPADSDLAPPVRAALLLPLSVQRPEVARIATDMSNAAEMALFSLNMENIILLPLDTGGTAQGARRAMQDAINAGADIILGPLLADSVRASAPLAAEQGLTMIAFSSDFTVLDEHILLLNFSPEQDVEQILSFALSNGIRDYAALLPDNPYGNRVHTVLTRKMAQAGATLHGVERYPRVIDGPYEPARRLASLSREDGPPPFQALLLADDGQMLRIAAAALAYFDIAPPEVRLLGTHLWDNPDIFEEPALLHGWYPMPRSQTHEIFVRRYEELYAIPPNRLATLAYDAMSLVGLLAQEGGDWRTRPTPPDLLLRPGGFTGVQGLFRFLPGGRSERALAIWEIEEQGAKLLQPPRRSFDGGS